MSVETCRRLVCDWPSCPSLVFAPGGIALARQEAAALGWLRLPPTSDVPSARDYCPTHAPQVTDG